MAQWVTVLTVEPEALCLIPQACMVEGASLLRQGACILTATYGSWHTPFSVTKSARQQTRASGLKSPESAGGKAVSHHTVVHQRSVNLACSCAVETEAVAKGCLADPLGPGGDTRLRLLNFIHLWFYP